MPKKAKELTATEVRRLTKPGFYPVGGVAGLALNVTPSGSRSWILRAQVGIRRRDIGLGGFPDVTLALARERARETREQIKQGIDPVDRRKEARMQLIAKQERLTFEQAACAYLETKEHEWKNPKHRLQWYSTLETYAYPKIGSRPVAEIDLSDVLSVLQPIWNSKTETANRLRGRIESVLDWATVAKHRTADNPARWKGYLDKVLASPKKISKVKHLKALPWQEIGAFVTDLQTREGMGARAVEFLILTAARSGEVRGATWDEIDLDAKTWTIPGERMKAGKDHTVPLAPAAIKLLKSMGRFKDCDLLFPSSRNKPLSDMTLTTVLRRMEIDATVHGFRSTFRDWASESTNYARDVCEMALAHKIPDKVEASYRRGELLAKRSRLMNDWAKYLNTVRTGDVVSIRGKGERKSTPNPERVRTNGS